MSIREQPLKLERFSPKNINIGPEKNAKKKKSKMILSNQVDCEQCESTQSGLVSRLHSIDPSMFVQDAFINQMRKCRAIAALEMVARCNGNGTYIAVPRCDDHAPPAPQAINYLFHIVVLQVHHAVGINAIERRPSNLRRVFIQNWLCKSLAVMQCIRDWNTYAINSRQTRLELNHIREGICEYLYLFRRYLSSCGIPAIICALSQVT